MRRGASSLLRVGVIGLGIGEQHVLGYMRSESCQVTYLCDKSDDKLAMAQSKYPSAVFTKNPNDILTNPDIDVVSIASFDEMHFDQVMLALKNGKHVFVEKPLCRSTKEIVEIKKAWKKHKGKVKLASNLILRAAPLYGWLREQVQAGELGEIYGFDSDYLYGRLEKITLGWRRKTPNYSVMLGGGVHLIDLMLWITGQKPTHAFALGNRICTEKTEFRYNDYVASMLRFKSSLVGRITSNFGCVHRHHHAMRIFGTKKTFIYDDQGPRLHFTRDPQKHAEPITLNPLPHAKGDLIPDFVSSIVKGIDTGEQTQIFFDGIMIASACDLAVKSKKEEKIHYV